MIEHYDKVFHAQELGSYAQGQGFLAVFKVTARDQGHYKGPSGAFVTYTVTFLVFLQILEQIKPSSDSVKRQEPYLYQHLSWEWDCAPL